MTQVPRSALVVLATFVATASAAIYLAQLHLGNGFSISVPAPPPSVTSDLKQPPLVGCSNTLSFQGGDPFFNAAERHHIHAHPYSHHQSGHHGPMTLQEALSVVSRNEFYARVREWIVLFIAFLFLYTLSYSILEWLRWKVRVKHGLRNRWSSARMRDYYKSRSRTFSHQHRSGVAPSSLTGIDQEISDYTRKRRRISSAVDPYKQQLSSLPLRQQQKEVDDEDDGQDESQFLSTGVDKLVTMVTCAIGIAVAQGAFLMLPTTLVVNAVFASFGQGPQLDRLYLGWLDPSLLHNSAENIALLTDVVMFILVPFAFFYYEQETLRRGFWPKCQNALAAVFLIDVLYVSGVWAVKNLILGLEHIDPIAVMRVSRVVLGWLGFIVTVPLGMKHLFRLAATLPVRIGSRQYARTRLAQLECEYAVWVAKLEDKDRELARERSLSSTCSKNLKQQQTTNARKRSFAVAGTTENQANPFSGYVMSRYEILGKLRLLEHEIGRLRQELYVSPWRRNAAFFGLLAFSLSIYCRLLVLLAKSIIFGHPIASSSPPATPTVDTIASTQSTSSATAAPTLAGQDVTSLPLVMTFLTGSFSTASPLWDAAVDIFWIVMVMALSLYGLYHHPYYRKLRPHHARTSPLAMIANVPIMLTLATASWSLMVDCLGLLQSPSVWTVRIAEADVIKDMTADGCPIPRMPPEDQTRKLLWDTDVFDQVMGEKRPLLESLVRMVMFVALSMLSAQWIVHRLIRWQSRR
ncbi:Limb region 1 -like protein [Actinomortierella wolfii]|nr:Limb region 1 -like protein [Actinomortierella wolfii]